MAEEPSTAATRLDNSPTAASVRAPCGGQGWRGAATVVSGVNHSTEEMIDPVSSTYRSSLWRGVRVLPVRTRDDGKR